MDSLYFSFDGIKSEDMGVYLVSVETGLKEEHFLPGREIVKERIRGVDESYVFDFIDQPLLVSLTISPLEGYWTTDKRREIGRWLGKKKYCEFYSTDDINKRYFLTYVGDPRLFTNGIKQGYITLDFENISPYTYSPIYEKIYDFSTITSPTLFTFNCDSDINVYPEMWIEKVEDGDISIKNLSDGGREFKFEGLKNNEILHIYNKHRYIETSIPDIYRYDNFNGNYLYFVYGINTLQIEGKCKLKFRYRFALKG